MVDGAGVPLVILTAGANASDHRQILPVVMGLPRVGGVPGRSKELPDEVYADRGYDSEPLRGLLRWWASSRSSPGGGRRTAAAWGRSAGWWNEPSPG